GLSLSSSNRARVSGRAGSAGPHGAEGPHRASDLPPHDGHRDPLRRNEAIKGEHDRHSRGGGAMIGPRDGGLDRAASGLVVAMTGASGAPYAIRLLQVLCQAGRSVHFTLSPSAVQVIREETGLAVGLDHFDPTVFGDLGPGRLIYHHHEDFTAGIASGSFLTG